MKQPEARIGGMESQPNGPGSGLHQQQQMHQAMPAPVPQISNSNNSHQINGWQGGTLRQQRTTEVRQEHYGKRFSLLDPEIFVPAAGSRLHSSPSAHMRAPSPWKPVGGTVCSKRNGTSTASRVLFEDGSGAGCTTSSKTLTPSSSYSNPAPRPLRPSASSLPSSSPAFVRQEKDDDFLPSLSAPAHASPAATLLPPMSSLCVSPASMDGSTQSNAGSNDSNNFSNYTNYFYQTLKHENPYQNLPESILL